MNIEFLLSNHAVFPWITNNVGSFRGYIYDSHDKKIQGIEAIEYLRGKLLNNEKLPISGLNGSFSAVITIDSICFAISDAIAAFPLFYSVNESGTWIGDDANVIADRTNIQQRTDTDHFEIFSICPRNETLFPNVFQILAGEGITVNNGKVSRFIHGQIADYQGEAKLEIQQVWDATLDRMLSNEVPLKWVVPLSGGWDSRLILASLWDRGVRNIVTYTYGVKDSFEVEAAQHVAKTLGLDWHFVEYDAECLSAFWRKEVQQFFKTESRGAFSIQEQELFALLHLKEQGVIHSGYIAVPGYCGDLLAGSYSIPGLLKDQPFDAAYAWQWIQAKHLSFIDEIESKKFATELLRAQLFDCEHITMGDWLSHYEKWFTQQKVSKYILSGLRSYEFAGLEWRMPFWDRTWMDYWYQQPLEKRWDRIHFKQWANRRYFEPLSISMRIESESAFEVDGWKERLRLNYPSVFSTLKRLAFWRKSADINNSRNLEKEVSSRLIQHGIQPRIARLNSLLAQWVLWMNRNR